MIEEIGFIKSISQRFGAYIAQQSMAFASRGLHQIHSSKATRIVESDAGAFTHVKDHMIMFANGRVVLHKAPQRVA